MVCESTRVSLRAVSVQRALPPFLLILPSRDTEGRNGTPKPRDLFTSTYTFTAFQQLSYHPSSVTLLFSPSFFTLLISDISYAPEITTLLTDEIQAEGEYLSFRINLIETEEDSADGDRGAEMKENVLAQGSVALWVMIEDSCSILRQVTCTSACSKIYLHLVFHLKLHYCSRVNSRLLSYDQNF
jgi:hypothetical protein